MKRLGLASILLLSALSMSWAWARSVPPPPDPGLEASVRAADVIAEVEVLAGGPFRAAVKVHRTWKGKAPAVCELEGYNSLNGDTVHAGFPTGYRYLLFLSRTDKPDTFSTLTPSATRLSVDEDGVMLTLGRPVFRIPVKMSAMETALELMLAFQASGKPPERGLKVIKEFWAGNEIELRYLGVALAGFLREPRSVPVLLEASKAQLLRLRLTAIGALRKVATPEALAALRGLARDSRTTVAREAVSALIALEDLASVPELLAWASKAAQKQSRYPKGDRRRKKVQSVVTAMRGFLDRKGAVLDPDEVCLPLFDLARGPDDTIAGDALFLLGRLARKQHVARLIELADDPVFAHKQDALAALARVTLKDEPDLDRLRAWWKEAFEGFGEDLKREIVESAAQGLKGETFIEERDALLRSIFSAPGGIALVSAAPLLMSERSAYLFDTLEISRWRTPLALPFLLERLGYSTDSDRRGALMTLVVLAAWNPRLEPLVLPFVRGALSDEYGGMRRTAASSAGMLGDERAMEPLLDALRLYGAYEADQAAKSIYALSARTMGYGPYEPVADLESAAGRLSGWWESLGPDRTKWITPIQRTQKLRATELLGRDKVDGMGAADDSAISNAAFRILLNDEGTPDAYWGGRLKAQRVRDRAYGVVGLLACCADKNMKAEACASLRERLQALLSDKETGDLLRALAIVGMASVEGGKGSQWLTTWLTEGAGAKSGPVWRRLATVALGLGDGEKTSLAYLSVCVDRALVAEVKEAEERTTDIDEDTFPIRVTPTDPDIALLRAAITALCARADGTPVLVRALASDSSSIRETALRSLGIRGHRGAIMEMLKVLERSRKYTVGDLVRIVAPLLGKKDVKVLREMLVRVEEVSRLAAAWLLSKRWRLADDPDTRSALMSALKDESDFVRARAAEALGKMRAKEAAPLLVPLLRVWDTDVKASAAEALAEIGDAAGCAAAALAAKELYRLDARWIRALGVHGGDSELKMLMRFSKSDRWVDQRVGIDALGLCKRPEALARLLEIYRDDESAFQSHAMVALASQGDVAARALDTVLGLKSEKKEDRLRAVYALGRIPTLTAAKKLMAALREPELRELAAFGLRRLAGGKDAGYDPKSAPAQRAAAAQRWLDLISNTLQSSGHAR